MADLKEILLRNEIKMLLADIRSLKTNLHKHNRTDTIQSRK